MIEIDGSQISGGGQIIRTALALSAYTNKPFHITHIRAGRPKPGLMAQHLEAVRAMQVLCNADVQGMRLGSEELTFIPKGFTPKPLDIHIGTAGAITLLVQALALPAMHHKKTTYTVHGGTDVRWSPPIDYLRYVVAPMLAHFGLCEVTLKRRGYYPRGGGSVEFTFGLKQDVKPLTLLERGLLEQITILNNASQKLMDKQICEDIERSVRVYFEKFKAPLVVRNMYVNSIDEGYGVLASAQFNLGMPRTLFAADILGDEAGSPQEAANLVFKRFQAIFDAQGCIDEHLADHLIPFLGIHGGEFTAAHVSNHVLANIAVTEKFLDVKFVREQHHIRVIRQS